MDTDGQQQDINDHIGQAGTELCVEQIISVDQDDACGFSKPNCNSSGKSEFNQSSTHCEDVVDDNNESHESKTWKFEQLKEEAKNGEDMQMAIEGKEEEDFEVASEVSFLKDASRTSSPSRNFKSSYAKSLADSYRRASLPVIVSAPKGQFYFKNEEFLSLNSSQMNVSTFNQDRFFSLNASTNKSALSQSFEPLSLPPILDVASEPEDHQAGVIKSGRKASSTNIFEQLLVDGDMYVPYERICSFCAENGGSFSLQDWHTLGSVTTSDGRKLIKVSDLQAKWKKQNQDILLQNGHTTAKSSDRDAQVESMVMEREQLEGRVEQLCEVLADRDATIQRLEEDLLRIRMECQRLLVDNRSLKSNIGHAGVQPSGSDAPSEEAKLQQQVQLLTAQLSKAERSRHTYEAATRQLVDFLHTVNSTLNMTTGQTSTSAANMFTSHSTGTSLAASPTTSLHSMTSPTVSHSNITPTTVSSNAPPDDDGDEDPPYRLANPKTASQNLVSSSTSHTFGPVRRNSDAVRKAGSVWALPTQSGNPRRVNRAVSTYCVASAASGSSHSNTGAPLNHDRGRSLTSDFLASRARELIASLKSLMRSDSILKLNLEPKKSGSSVNSNSSSSRSMKTEGSSSVTSVEKSDNKAVTKEIRVGRQNSGHGEDKQGTGTLHHDNTPGDKSQNIAEMSENNASPAVNQNYNSTNNIGVAPRINNDTIRDDVSQTQSLVDVNSNPQPLSLLVVGESSSAHDDHRFSSLPNRSCVSRTLNDSEHRLVWV